MKPSNALEIMKSVLKGGNSVFLQGEVGIGKSATVMDLVKVLAKGKKIVNNVKPRKMSTVIPTIVCHFLRV